MPTVERCFCTIVLAPKFLSENCPTALKDASVVEREDLWFTDDKELLKNSMKWTPEQLDQLLERVEFCSKYLLSDGDVVKQYERARREQTTGAKCHTKISQHLHTKKCQHSEIW